MVITCSRRQNTAAEVGQSFRQRAWLLARERYKDHEHVHYSSVLETKIKPSFSIPETQQHLPDDWMDDYEFYQGAQEGGISRARRILRYPPQRFHATAAAQTFIARMPPCQAIYQVKYSGIGRSRNCKRSPASVVTF